MKSSSFPSFILNGIQLTDALETSWGKNPGKEDQGSRVNPQSREQAQKWGLCPEFWVTNLSAFTAIIQIGVQLKMEMQVDPKMKEMGNNNMLDWLRSAGLFLN